MAVFPKSAQKVPNHTNKTVPTSTKTYWISSEYKRRKSKIHHIKHKTFPKFEKLERIELFSFSANILTISP